MKPRSMNEICRDLNGRVVELTDEQLESLLRRLTEEHQDRDTRRSKVALDRMLVDAQRLTANDRESFLIQMGVDPPR